MKDKNPLGENHTVVIGPGKKCKVIDNYGSEVDYLRLRHSNPTKNEKRDVIDSLTAPMSVDD